MPGVAQVWLTDDELDIVSAGLACLEDEGWGYPVADVDIKIRAAREGVACPTPAKEDALIKTDGTPTIAWDPRPLPADTPPIHDPPLPGPSVDGEELDLVGALTLAP